MTHLEAVKKLIWLTRSDYWFSLAPPEPNAGDWGHLTLPSAHHQSVRLRKWAWCGSDVGLELGIPLLGSLCSLMLSRMVVLAYRLRDDVYELTRASIELLPQWVEGTRELRIEVQIAADRFRTTMSYHRDLVLHQGRLT